MQQKQMSPDIEKYFKEIEKKVKEEYDIASKSKKLRYDPKNKASKAKLGRPSIYLE